MHLLQNNPGDSGCSVFDAILLPVGILLVIRLIPPAVMAECRARAEAAQRPVSRAGAAFVILAWIAAAAALGWLLLTAG